MKILAIAGILISTSVLGQNGPVKMSKTGICHAPIFYQEPFDTALINLLLIGLQGF